MAVSKQETLSVGLVEYYCGISERLDSSDIHKGEKTPVWDGNIIFYEEGKPRIVGKECKIPVQIKGKEVEKLSFNSLQYRVEKKELLDFLHDLGVLYIVVEIEKQTNERCMYLKALMPEDIIDLLSNKTQRSFLIKLFEIKNATEFEKACADYVEKKKESIIKKIFETSNNGQTFNMLEAKGIVLAEKQIQEEDNIVIRKINEEISATNVSQLTVNRLETMPQEITEYIRKQLGDRLTGDETRIELEERFIDEIHRTLESKERYGVIDLFNTVVRDNYDAYVYLGDARIPLNRVTVSYMYANENEHFLIIGNGYILHCTKVNGELAHCRFDYNLSQIDDVNARLLKFREIQSIVQADIIRVEFIDKKEHDFVIDKKDGLCKEDYIEAGLSEEEAEEKTNAWEKNKIITEEWISIMEAVSVIEQEINVKFYLPEKGTEEDWLAIAVLTNSIERKCCRTLPPLTCSEDDLSKTEEICIDEPTDFGMEGAVDIDLFGYTFTPVRQVVLPCKLTWSEQEKGFITENGTGIPLCVQFRPRRITELYCDDNQKENYSIIVNEQLISQSRSTCIEMRRLDLIQEKGGYSMQFKFYNSGNSEVEFETVAIHSDDEKRPFLYTMLVSSDNESVTLKSKQVTVFRIMVGNTIPEEYEGNLYLIFKDRNGEKHYFRYLKRNKR